jgi:SMP-30/Gluconolactonase/LRE-like region
MNSVANVFLRVALGAFTVLAFAQCARVDVPQTLNEEAINEATTEETSDARHAPVVNLTVTGFERPESVLHDTRNDVYLVSSINGGPRDVDDNGFISRLSPNGQVLDLKWIEGGVNGVTLNAPKGSTIANGILYVADIDNLRKFDARTGKPLGSIFLPVATFLNDVASDRRGNVYVTDIGFTTVPAFGESGTDAIYKITPRDKVSVIAKGNGLLNHPNGVAVLPNGKLQVVTYDPFKGTKELYTIDMSGNKDNVITMPTGLLDGVVVVKGRGLLVSSWVGFADQSLGKVYLVKPDGSITEVATGFTNYAADIGWDTKRSRLLVPELPDPGTGGRVDIRTLNLR